MSCRFPKDRNTPCFRDTLALLGLDSTCRFGLCVGMELTVRAARLEDLEAMVELLGRLFGQEAEFHANPERQRAALRSILALPDHGSLLVAQWLPEIVGMVSLHYTISTAEGGTAAWLEDMVVDPRFRGRGVGSRLVEAAFATCRTKGVRRVTLLTDKVNASAQRFYRRHGFAESPMLPMRCRLD